MNKEIKEKIKREARLELCRRDFFFYCKTMKPEFYVESAKEADFLKELCFTLQDFIFNDTEHNILVVNMPPRHGKSFTAQNFCQFYLGHFPKNHVMVGTYNEDLSTTFSKNIRDTIGEQKGGDDKIIYSDIFPETRIRRGSAAMKRWNLDHEGAYNSFMVTSPGGSATGYGYNLLILDDTIKDAAEAFNPNQLEKLWTWYTSTMKSRREKDGKTIVIATRWSEKDISGRLIEKGEENSKIRILSYSAVKNWETHEMLCPDLLWWEKFCEDTEDMDERIVSANYQQICIDNVNRLYKTLKTYDFHDYCNKFRTQWDKDNPNFKKYDGTTQKPRLPIYSYCDTADEGTDYLCNIIFSFDYSTRMAYILDVYYVQNSMEITEKETARRINEFGVDQSLIESNNGGRGFARNVQRELQETYKNYRNTITWFYNGANKISRIQSGASKVCKFCYFPSDWSQRWPEFYRDLKRFEANGSALHDDMADAITGVVETLEKLGGI